MIPVISILLAIIPPCVAIFLAQKNRPLKNPHIATIISFIFCALLAIIELYVVKVRCNAGDIAGVLDTIDGALILCVAVLIISAFANVVMLIKYNGK